MYNEQICALALTRIPGLGTIGACHLLKALGSASAVFQQRKELPELVSGATLKLVKALDNPDAFRRAEEEIRFAERNHIQCIPFTDTNYPSRLRECEDAPLALFYRGNADLNALRIISIVGTRHATDYGKDLCASFVRDLAELCPDVLIVSGLAYGIDIQAHKYAIQYGFKTIGVLAHGLDRIYPAAHRKTAISMLNQGGLLTEFMSGSNPDRQNFIKRNRIVAGMSDATLVIESASKGGALITAELAESYHRDCFAFPGRISDPYSSGCNELIKNNRASLLLSAENFVYDMGWKTDKTLRKKNIQRELFPELTEEENKAIQMIQKSKEGIHINRLVMETNIPVNRMTALLFDLEMKGVIRASAGGVYRLIE